MPATATDQSLPPARSSGHPDAPVDRTPVASSTIPHDRRLATATCS
jgi:hypothetical protein